MTKLQLVLAMALVIACNDAPPQHHRTVDLDLPVERDELRADAREGLERAIDDPASARALERAFTQLSSAPEVVESGEKLLARVGLEKRLKIPADEFFTNLQASAGMRAALAEYARANPELEVDAIAAGFVGHVDARLTRPELAEQIRIELGEQLGTAGPVLGAALLREAGGAARLADRVADHLVDPAMAPALDQRLGRDHRANRLHDQLTDPRHAADLLLAVAESLQGPEGVALLSGLLDDEAVAPVLAEAIARVLDDADFREEAALVFEDALAAELDPKELEHDLEALFALPIIHREAATVLAELARRPSIRDQVAGFVDRFATTPQFEAALLDVID